MDHATFYSIMHADEIAAEQLDARLRRAARGVIAACTLSVLALASPPLAALLLLLLVLRQR